METRYWVPTFDDAIARANGYFYAGQYHDAYVEYQVAASVATRGSYREAEALRHAWIARAREERWRSDLDYEPGTRS
jgi:predicted Zn-dependent protease